VHRDPGDSSNATDRAGSLPFMPVQNAEVTPMFDQAAELLEIEGENQFRVRAYRRAAQRSRT